MLAGTADASTMTPLDGDSTGQSLDDPMPGDVARVLTPDGEVVDGATVPDLTDDELLDIYREIAFARRFDARSSVSMPANVRGTVNGTGERECRPRRSVVAGTSRGRDVVEHGREILLARLLGDAAHYHHPGDR